MSERETIHREAHELGLVTRVVADDALAQVVDTLLGDLRRLSPAVLRMSRRALRGQQQDEVRSSSISEN